MLKKQKSFVEEYKKLKQSKKKEKGFPSEIIIEIKAEAKDEFDRTTLDTKVKETLQQIGAQIERWEEG